MCLSFCATYLGADLEDLTLLDEAGEGRLESLDVLSVQWL
jgi:hypothetical protein